jgi:hypothetical protein
VNNCLVSRRRRSVTSVACTRDCRPNRRCWLRAIKRFAVPVHHLRYLIAEPAWHDSAKFCGQKLKSNLRGIRPLMTQAYGDHLGQQLKYKAKLQFLWYNSVLIRNVVYPEVSWRSRSLAPKFPNRGLLSVV